MSVCRLLRKSAYPFGQVQTKIYLPESPFFQKFACWGKRASTYVGAWYLSTFLMQNRIKYNRGNQNYDFSV